MRQARQCVGEHSPHGRRQSENILAVLVDGESAHRLFARVRVTLQCSTCAANTAVNAPISFLPTASNHSLSPERRRQSSHVCQICARQALSSVHLCVTKAPTSTAASRARCSALHGRGWTAPGMDTDRMYGVQNGGGAKSKLRASDRGGSVEGPGRSSSDLLALQFCCLSTVQRALLLQSLQGAAIEQYRNAA